MAAATEATERSYAPYSGVRVGAAAETTDGRLLVGSNTECASIGLSLCAECAVISDLARTGGGRLRRLVAVDAAGDPARTLELQESYGQLLAAFDRLSPMLRTTVVLTTLQGLNYSEAAVVLDTTEGTIAWRVHEARKKLRKEMARLQKDPTPVEVKQRARTISQMRDKPEMWTAIIGQLLGDGKGHVA